MTEPPGVPEGLGFVTVVVIVTVASTTTGDEGLAVVVTVVVPFPGNAEAGDELSRATPPTNRTDAATIENTCRNLPRNLARGLKTDGSLMVISSLIEV
ncbi:MAG: hypothetical protein WAN30_08745 [Acidimicrobiales bacterium]